MNIDFIFLSKTENIFFKNLLQGALKSLILSNIPSINNFTINIIESSTKPIKLDFKHANIINFDKSIFNYNRAINLGLKHCKNDWICICNNDLIFDKNWISNIKNIIDKEPDILSISPISPTHIKHRNLYNKTTTPIYLEGYTTGLHVCGWCILVHKSIIDKIGTFDETFDFYFQDNDYAETIKKLNVRHVLATKSVVTHIQSQSSKKLDKRTKFNTDRLKFSNKWGN